jgi:hypothetical protein
MGVESRKTQAKSYCIGQRQIGCENEHSFAKVGVEGSNPFARSKFAKEIKRHKPRMQGLPGRL